MFNSSTIEKLAYYVYFLQDPRDKEIFYIGKGRGNRVFYHLSDALASNENSLKFDRIREIVRSGYEVEHFILRHGLTEAMAFELEAAFIDLMGMHNLSNLMGGHYSSDYGLKSVDEIVSMYAADPIHTDKPVLLININKFYRRDITSAQLYEVTRMPWSLGERRNKIQYAVAVYNGLTREVYEVRKWFPIRINGNTRWGFKGRMAKKRSIREELLHKSIQFYFKRGASNPVRYLNC